MKKNFKRAVLLLMGGYFIYAGLKPFGCGMVDLADLALHEAGHVLFGMLGVRLGIWGGTLVQLLVPILIAVHFAERKDPFAVRLVLCWLGQNFFNISFYIKDARAELLPLAGGRIHDWHFILGRIGLLNMDQWIGDLVWFMGLIVIVQSVLAGIIKVGEEETSDGIRP